MLHAQRPISTVSISHLFNWSYKAFHFIKIFLQYPVQSTTFSNRHYDRKSRVLFFFFTYTSKSVEMYKAGVSHSQTVQVGRNYSNVRCYNFSLIWKIPMNSNKQEWFSSISWKLNPIPRTDINNLYCSYCIWQVRQDIIAWGPNHCCCPEKLII